VNELPLVSIIIPCRNEEKFIGACLDSVIDNDYPQDKLDILVVDGASEDGTREMVEGYTRRYPFINILANPDRIFASALNIGIRHSKGYCIAIMSAHASYSNDYIPQCVKFLVDYDADDVGGRLRVLPANETQLA
jgi:glycosyltransferase involved in cell wall biosynthesis